MVKRREGESIGTNVMKEDRELFWKIQAQREIQVGLNASHVPSSKPCITAWLMLKLLGGMNCTGIDFDIFRFHRARESLSEIFENYLGNSPLR